MDMVTISADVTKQMLQWADVMVKKGLYKSRSEVVRELFRKNMKEDDPYLMSYDALKEAWKDEDDAKWEKYLTKEEKKKLGR
jgi:Arc/MetJ-type ribon-helix-helix transcriptional regulator